VPSHVKATPEERIVRPPSSYAKHDGQLAVALEQLHPATSGVSPVALGRTAACCVLGLFL
jgi:hypothetical protein